MAQARRLHELLKDPQEPFYVDVYLTERGYSTKLLEAQEKLSLAWPLSVSKRQLRLRNDFTRKRGGFGRGFLSKIFYGKFVRKTTKCEKKAIKNEMASQNHERTFNCFMEELGSETKNHSPVSVLEMHHCEVSPADSNEIKQKLQKFFSLIDSPILEELQSMHHISESTQHDPKEQNPVGFEEYWDLNLEESTTNEERSSSFSLEREYVEAIREIVVSELAESMANWGNFKFDMNREIGTEIEDAILEEIKEELVLEIFESSCGNGSF